MEEDIKNLEEIINLCKEEINNNDKNITAILDSEDLKSLKNFLDRYKQLEEKLEIKKNTPEWEYQYWEARKEVDNEWESKVKEKITSKCKAFQHRSSIEKILECEFKRLEEELLGKE